MFYVSVYVCVYMLVCFHVHVYGGRGRCWSPENVIFQITEKAIPEKGPGNDTEN